MKTPSNSRLIYIARSPIPSEQANSIQVAKMCAGFARHLPVELVVPYRRENAQHTAGLWERYAVPRCFRVTQLRYPHWGDHFAVRGYALAAASFARYHRFPLAYTRDPWAAYWLARAGVRTGFEAHDLAEDRRYPIWESLVREKDNLPGLQGVFCISRSLMEDYRAAGARANLLHMAPDGVDLERFLPEKSKAEARRILDLPQDVFLLCHCGHMYPERGMEELLTALVSFPDVMLELVGGKPEDIKRVREYARALGVEGRIRFMGIVPNGEVPIYLWAADALIMPYTSRVPTQRAMSPLKMFEYMAASRPIIATDFRAIREVLRDGENAILVEPDSPAALTMGIQTVRKDSRMADRIAVQARKDVEEYTWERRAKSILEIINS